MMSLVGNRGPTDSHLQVADCGRIMIINADQQGKFRHWNPISGNIVSIFQYAYFLHALP